MQQQYPSQYGGQSPQVPSYAGMPVGQPKKGLNILLIPFIVVVVALLAVTGFALWAYTSRQDYKNNVDSKIASAVEIAKQETATTKDKEFVEKEKYPLKKYQAAGVAGNLQFQYPKTWSAFITEDGRSNTVIDGYFHPNFVPGTQSGTDFALRLKVISRSYAEEMKQFESKVKQGKVKVSPFKAKRAEVTVIGSRVDGEINTGQQDSMILFPLRDKTIMISTESAQFLGDFNNIVLADLTFVP